MCVLSPSLFNVYTEAILKQAEELVELNINGRKINTLRYYSDTVLLAENERVTRIRLEQANRNNAECGFTINIFKK